MANSYKFNSADEIKALKLGKTYKHTIDLLIDALKSLIANESRLQEAIETAFKYAQRGM